MSLPEKSPKLKTESKLSGRKRAAHKRKYRSPMERGLSPAGGGWNIAQAAEWSGLSEIYLRALIKRKKAGEDVSVFP